MLPPSVLYTLHDSYVMDIKRYKVLLRYYENQKALKYMEDFCEDDVDKKEIDRIDGFVNDYTRMINEAKEMLCKVKKLIDEWNNDKGELDTSNIETPSPSQSANRKRKFKECC